MRGRSQSRGDLVLDERFDGLLHGVEHELPERNGRRRRMLHRRRRGRKNLAHGVILLVVSAEVADRTGCSPRRITPFTFSTTFGTRPPGVVESLDEAGDELVTYLKYPRAMWKCVRTTNAIERLNEEIRRRLKTQCQLGSPRTPVLLIYGLVESGQIRMRRIDGWQHLSKKSSPARRRAG
jgi:hypothetical protein